MSKEEVEDNRVFLEDLECSEATETTDELREMEQHVEDNGQYRKEIDDKRGDSLDEEPVTEKNLDEKVKRAMRLEMIRQNTQCGEKWESKSKIKALKEHYKIQYGRKLIKSDNTTKTVKEVKEKKPKKEETAKAEKLGLQSVLNQIEMIHDNENKMYITIEKGNKKVRFEIV